MKQKVIKGLVIAFIVLCILGVIGFYIFDVVYNQTDYTQNLFRAVLIIAGLIVTLLRVIFSGRRQSLDFYEKSYEKEIGQAFKNSMLRNKLLCAVRLYNEDRYNKALKYLSELYPKAENDRDAVAVLLFSALCYTDMGLNEQAIRTYYKLLEIDNRHEQAHSNLGLIYVHEGNYEMAVKHFDESIRCQPDNYYAYINRASCYFRQADYDRAEKDAIKSLEFKNNGIEATSLLTIIYALKGDIENKKKYFHISVANGKNPDDINEAIEYYMKAQRDSEDKSDE
ncbi:MAG: tetratricopeptide repeat protein [Clostridia bacterium]|nr:tetratricopeptide repeat protein [Clostridia bacterium]